MQQHIEPTSDEWFLIFVSDPTVRTMQFHNIIDINQFIARKKKHLQCKSTLFLNGQSVFNPVVNDLNNFIFETISIFKFFICNKFNDFNMSINFHFMVPKKRPPSFMISKK